MVLDLTGSADGVLYMSASGWPRCLTDVRVLALDPDAYEHQRLASGLGAKYKDYFTQHDPPDVCVGTNVCSKTYRVTTIACSLLVSLICACLAFQ